MSDLESFGLMILYPDWRRICPDHVWMFRRANVELVLESYFTLNHFLLLLHISDAKIKELKIPAAAQQSLQPDPRPKPNYELSLMRETQDVWKHYSPCWLTFNQKNWPNLFTVHWRLLWSKIFCRVNWTVMNNMPVMHRMRLKCVHYMDLVREIWSSVGGSFLWKLLSSAWRQKRSTSQIFSAPLTSMGIK